MIALDVGSRYKIITKSNSEIEGELCSYTTTSATLILKDESQVTFNIADLKSFALVDIYDVDEFMSVSSSFMNAYMSGLDLDTIAEGFSIAQDEEELDAALEISIDLKDLVEVFYGRDPAESYYGD